jgi:hypothetical protein
MAKQRPLAALILALALPSCAAPARRPGDGPRGDLEVTSHLEIATSQPREGDLATVSFMIRNSTNNYVLLRDLTVLADPELNESASAAATWQFGQEGKLTYVPDANEWKFERPRKGAPGDKPQITAPLYNSALLVPTESITVRTRFRLLRMPKLFQLLYFELSLDKVRSDVYFEARQDREVRYRAFIGDELKARLIADPKVDVSSHRTVLYPFAERVEPSAKIMPLKVEVDLRPRTFPLAEAVRKSGGAAVDQYTYCSALEAWVLKRGAAFSFVTASAVTPLPVLRQMDRTFYFIDHRGVEKIEVGLQNDAVASIMQLEKKWTVVVNKLPRETKYFLFISSSDLMKFFADVRSANLVLDVEMTPDGGGRLWLLR